MNTAAELEYVLSSAALFVFARIKSALSPQRTTDGRTDGRSLCLARPAPTLSRPPAAISLLCLYCASFVYTLLFLYTVSIYTCIKLYECLLQLMCLTVCALARLHRLRLHLAPLLALLFVSLGVGVPFPSASIGELRY